MKKNTLRAHERIFQPPKQTAVSASKHDQGSRRALVYRDHYAHTPSQLGILKRVLIGIVIVLIAQSFFQVPVFRLRGIAIGGLEYIPEDSVQTFIASELQRRRFIIFRNDNYFLFAKQRLRKRLEDTFFVTVVSIEKKFPHRLVITLTERISAFVVQTPEKYMQLDTSGNAMRTIDKPSGRQSVIADERSDKTKPITRDYLELITSIKKQWEQILPGVALEKFHLTDDNTIVIVSTNKGFRVFFDPSKDIAKQLQRLQLFLADTSLQQPHEYIDLRFDESLYSK